LLNIYGGIIWPFVCLLLGNACSVPLPIFNWVIYFLALGCLGSLHILDMNPLSDVWFAKIFSHSVDCLFTLLIIFFAVQKTFSLARCDGACL
uniref:Uncharacterized protein n=1 Tax=Sciurus vulgaris TaxID=55149 RepID=A0A8D2ANP7_SCIVU